VTRPLELVNTVLLTVIAVLLAILVLTPPTQLTAPAAQPLNVPLVDCQVAQLFEEGEQLECIPVRLLDAP
jgi:hypothetical protein